MIMQLVFDIASGRSSRRFTLKSIISVKYKTSKITANHYYSAYHAQPPSEKRRPTSLLMRRAWPVPLGSSITDISVDMHAENKRRYRYKFNSQFKSASKPDLAIQKVAETHCELGIN